MTDNTKLIAEARERASYVAPAQRDLYTDKATLESRLADALEAAEVKLDVDLEEIRVRDAEIARFAAVFEQAKEWATEHVEYAMPVFPDRALEILNSVDTGAALREWLATRPVTDAEVEAAARLMFEPPSTAQLEPEYTWAEMVVEDPSRADMWRADARSALEAARAAIREGRDA